MVKNKSGLMIPGAAKKFKPEHAVKYFLSRNFYLDGNLLIERFDLVKTTSSMNNQNFASKAVVDLTMSIECSLKSLVLSLSRDNERPITAYKKARKQSHNIRKLLKIVVSRSKNKLKIPDKLRKLINEFLSIPKDVAQDNIFKDIETLDVITRYTYEVWLLKYHKGTGSVIFGTDLISRTVNDNRWGNRLRKLSVELNKLSHKSIKRAFSGHRTLFDDRHDRYNAEMQKFLLGI